MTGNVRKIVMLSDVSVGYGSPQILSMSASLASHFSSPTVLFEPDQPERPPPHLAIPDVEIRRIYTATHPYTASGRTEYCMATADQLNSIRPDVVVLVSFLAAPVIAKLDYRPKLVIYYALEHTDGRKREERLFQQIADRIDLAIFPEEHRALLDRPRLGLEGVPTAIIYNGSNADVAWINAAARNNRFFYGGLLHPKLTYGDWFLGGGLDAYTIDIYGIIDGYPNRDSVLSDLSARHSRIAYSGYVPSGAGLSDILRHYCYSIVIWAPNSESTLYAAPNKFFDALAAGVPCVVAPHPMCKKLVERYGCGIVIEDWSLAAMRRGLDKAQALLKTSAFGRLVDGCRRAHRDLAWPAQFKKVASVLDDLIAAGNQKHRRRHLPRV